MRGKWTQLQTKYVGLPSAKHQLVPWTTCLPNTVLDLCAHTRVLLNVRPTLPWGGGGWVGLAEFQGGWVSNHPPPPRVGWDFVGALGLLS